MLLYMVLYFIHSVEDLQSGNSYVAVMLVPAANFALVGKWNVRRISGPKCCEHFGPFFGFIPASTARHGRLFQECESQGRSLFSGCQTYPDRSYKRPVVAVFLSLSDNVPHLAIVGELTHKNCLESPTGNGICWSTAFPYIQAYLSNDLTVQDHE